MRYFSGVLIIAGSFFLLTHLSQAGAFDPLPVGARAQAMGQASTAAAGDPTAVYWNPAGLGLVHQPRISFSHYDIQSLGLLSYDYIAYAQPFVFNNSVALAWTRMSTSASVTFMNYAENTFTVAFQQPIVPEFSVGLNFKVFQVQYEKSGGGYGFDIGGRYQILPELAVAVMGENVGEPEIRWITGAVDRLPANLRAGVVGSPLPDLTLALDVDRILIDDFHVHLGAEVWFFENLMALRMGVRYLSQEGRYLPSGGLGFRFSFLEVAYAYSSHFAFDGNHVLSLEFGF